MSSSAVHDPLAFAIPTIRRPASVMRPSAISRSTRSLFDRAQMLAALRGVIVIFERMRS